MCVVTALADAVVRNEICYMHVVRSENLVRYISQRLLEPDLTGQHWYMCACDSICYANCSTKEVLGHFIGVSGG